MGPAPAPGVVRPPATTRLSSAVLPSVAVQVVPPPPRAPAAPRAARRRLVARRRSRLVPVLVGAAAFVLVAGGGIALWFLALAPPPVPDLLREVPAGTCVFYGTRENAAGELLPGAVDAATVIRDDFRTVQVMRGRFDPASFESRFEQSGYRRQTTGGQSLLVLGGQAVHLSPARVTKGSLDLVLETLRIRDGKGVPFVQTLTAEEKAGLRKLPRGDVWMILRGVPGKKRIWGNRFFALSGRRSGPGEVTADFVGSCPTDADERAIREELAKEGGFTILSATRSGPFLVGRLKTRTPAEP